MYYQDKQLCYSPSDLTCYSESPFASWMDRYATDNPNSAPASDTTSMLMERLKVKGLNHEQSVLQLLQQKHSTVITITGNNTSEKFNNTITAMEQGADLIVQAYLKYGQFAGFADFLVKVEGYSRWGDYHYEVWDAKLSKQLKTEFIIQLCCYTDMLTQIQGFQPEHFVIALGSGNNTQVKVDEHFYHYKALKQAFLNAQENFHANNIYDDAPDPVDSKSWGRWSTFASQLLIQRDHLLQVANIRRSQIKKLYRHDIYTMHQLANTTLTKIQRINKDVFQRLKAQAAIQIQSIGAKQPVFKILDHPADKKIGLALLPPHSDADVFFDIEGYPLFNGGLEYLWGSTYFNSNGQRSFTDFWAHNPEQEKQAFIQFINWVYQRWQQDPSMHIYHYANYEITACKRLMGRYGCCEHEIDELLRHEVFIDLYKIVRGGLLLGEPKYSIKNVERLYRGQRDTDVGNGSDSVAVYEQWRELYDAGEESDQWQSSTILKNIRDYNIDDCNSTQELVVWLRQQQQEHEITYIASASNTAENNTEEPINETRVHRDRLLKKSAEFSANNNLASAKLAENLAWSLEFHQRENKPVFWRLFERLGKSDVELLEDTDCLAGCQRTQREPFKLNPKARSLVVYEYQFDTEQEFKESHSKFYLLEKKRDSNNFQRVSYIRDGSDLSLGKILLQSSQELPESLSIVPDEYINPTPIPKAIQHVTEAYSNNTSATEGAIYDFLQRRPPNTHTHRNNVTQQAPSDPITDLINTVKNLNNSYLTIQGPPGAGKTYTGKHIIAALLQDGAKIGIASNSHKAINNLLLSTAKLCHHKSIEAQFACKENTEEDLEHYGVKILKNPKIAHFIDDASSKCLGVVVGTTAWGFAREDMQDKLDYLFIDEAGQVSVANLIAMSRCTKNIILMGDQMQLGQPSQTDHPADSGLSVLDYLLRDNPIISDNMGVFLDTTYRMHEKVNAFISKHIYQGKLKSHPQNNQQRIQPHPTSNTLIQSDAGLLFIPVEHEGNTQASPEEVDVIKKLAMDMLNRTFSSVDKHQRPITWNDMLFVAPYNHQVSKLQTALGPQARVGSVDKFQGQEAPVVFVSMCASDADESPRGLEFLLNKNRLNVAISRAQSLAIVVGNPQLGLTHVNSIEQLKLLNLYCALLEHQVID